MREGEKYMKRERKGRRERGRGEERGEEREERGVTYNSTRICW
jgi:hypothetical protein